MVPRNSSSQSVTMLGIHKIMTDADNGASTVVIPNEAVAYWPASHPPAVRGLSADCTCITHISRACDYTVSSFRENSFDTAVVSTYIAYHIV